MDQQAKIATTPPDDRPQPPARRPYEPPRAEFVPLRAEERLMACQKYSTADFCLVPADS